MKLHTDRYYMTVHESLKDKDGNPSIYNRLSNNGVCISLIDGWRDVTKAILKDLVEKDLSRLLTLKDYTCKETDYGWEYEMYVKWFNDGEDYEVVEVGEHTDHEVFTVDISYVQVVTDIFKKLE